MAMKIELVKKQLIKPASKTPDHLQTVQLSVLDKLLSSFYVAGIFFYSSDDHIISDENVTFTLKKSLSETLIRFYPPAGRINGVSINCNDEGAIFIEARTDCLFSEFMSNIYPNSLGQFLPSEFISSGEPPETWPLCNVKVTFFRSGGMAIGLCVSHGICDATSFATFVSGWAATTKGHCDVVNPKFTATTIYPPADLSFQYHNPMNENSIGRSMCITKRFVFHAPKVLELKRKAQSESVENPTRVEVITSLVWKCALKARTNSNIPKSSAMTVAMDSNIPRPFAMTVAMDLRRRSKCTYLTQNVMGNLLTSFQVKEGSESKMEICELVAKLRKNKEEMNEIIKENFQGDRITEEFGKMLMNSKENTSPELVPEMHIYTTSWCRLSFYEVDFGWGSPIWFTPANHTLYKNNVFIILTDTKDGEGIEAWVSLPEQDMFKFEHDYELLTFAVSNHSVLI